MSLYYHHGHEPAAVAAINRQREEEQSRVRQGQQCLAGWRWALEYTRDLIADMAALKGAQAFRGRIDTARHHLAGALAASDMTVLRNTTTTADVAIALAEADKAFPNGAWLFGRGMALGDPAAYGFAVFASPDDDRPLAEATAADPRAAVRAVVEKLDGRAVG